MALTLLNLALQTSGTLPAARIPVPTASTLGGVQSATAAVNQFQTGISTSGIPVFAQPSFSNLSGNVSAAQLPNPTASSLGGIQSLTLTTSKWISSISTLGVPSATQPLFSDISGSATNAQLPAQLFMAGVNPQVGTTYTFVATDINKLVVFNNAASIAVTLPQATVAGFTSGAQIHVKNLGVGTVTVTPTTSTIDGLTSFSLSTGQGADIYSDGTNYFIQKGSTTAAVTINFADGETPSGLINSSNATYTLTRTPVSVSLSLFLNGVLQRAGAGSDYTISGLTITMLNVPATGDTLLANYRY